MSMNAEQQQDLEIEGNLTGDEPVETTTSPEDKFLGVRTQIRPRAGDVESEVEVQPAEAEDSATETKSDDELEDYSARVQKRIDKLVWQQNEERRHREAAEAQAQEYLRYAQTVNQQNQQYEQTINQGEAYLIDQYKQRANMALEAARATYRKAYEEGDTESIIKAQEDMIAAGANLYQANAQEQDYQQRQQSYIQQQQFQQQQARMPRPQPQIRPPQPSNLAQEWAQKNEWFQKDGHEDMTATAFGLHEKLIKREGIKPDTDEYFNAIDAEMHKRYPEYFKDAGASASAPANVVAPAKRGGGKPRQVKLNANQRALIKKLGITPDQYARQMMKVQS